MIKWKPIIVNDNPNHFDKIPLFLIFRKPIIPKITDKDKIISALKKPNGLTIVKPKQVRRFLASLPVRRLMGIGKKTETKLESLGIRTIGQLANFDVQRLIEIFGRKMGTYFHQSSLGIDNEKIKERHEPESISRISTLKQDTNDFLIIFEATKELCNDVHSRLIGKNLLYIYIYTRRIA